MHWAEKSYYDRCTIIKYLITYLTKINCLNVAKVVGIPRLLFKVPMNPTMESTYYAIFDFSNEYVFKSAVIKFKLAATIVLMISDHLVSFLARASQRITLIG